MNRQFVDENAKERERLRTVANGMSDDELKLVLYKEGWTIAAALAHLAFWDRRRLLVVRKWQQKPFIPAPMDSDIINDALVPFFLALPPRKASELAIACAEELDHELEDVSPEFIAAMQESGDRHALNRAVHRKMHLDDIEALLKEKRKAK